MIVLIQCVKQCAKLKSFDTMKFNSIGLVICLLAVINSSACSRIKGYFPDKEKDYQFSTEIPALAIPADLSTDAIEDQNKPSDDIKVTVHPDKENVQENNKDKKEVIYVDLVEYAGGATRIRIEDSIERTWRVVGKALSRHSIEIIDRNETDRVYFVQYDAEFKKVEDGSLWDEALFIFGTDPAQEKEFRVRLAQNGALTEVIVLDKNDKPLSKGAGLKLLNLLYKTIKEDLSN